jgi:hypothetical protein
MSARAMLLGLACCACAFGTYTYDYSGVVPMYLSTQNGTVDAWWPITQFHSGGSLIWNPTVSGSNSNNYEVNTTLALASGGGTYVEYLRGSSMPCHLRVPALEVTLRWRLWCRPGIPMAACPRN